MEVVFEDFEIWNKVMSIINTRSGGIKLEDYNRITYDNSDSNNDINTNELPTDVEALMPIFDILNHIQPTSAGEFIAIPQLEVYEDKYYGFSVRNRNFTKGERYGFTYNQSLEGNTYQVLHYGFAVGKTIFETINIYTTAYLDKFTEQFILLC